MTTEERQDAGVGVTGRLRSYGERLFNLDGSWYDRAFTFVLLAFFAALLVMTLDYGSQTRLVPLVIGVPTFVLLLVLFAIQLSPRAASFAERFSSADLLDVSEQMEEIGSESESGSLSGGAERDADADPRAVRAELLAVSGWVLVLFGGIVLVGFLVGTFAFLVAFYRVRAEQGWLRTLAYSVIVWVFAVLVFKVVLNTPLYTGLLGIEVPLPI